MTTPASALPYFAVLVPAGTSADDPLVFDCSFDPATVNRIDILIPPGPEGTVGFQVGVLGGQVIPLNPGAWIIGDNQSISWPLTDMPDSGAWNVTIYNSDIYDHTLYFTFFTTPNPQPAAPSSVTPAGNSSLSSSPDAGDLSLNAAISVPPPQDASEAAIEAALAAGAGGP